MEYTQHVNIEPSITNYLNRFTEKEKEAFARVQEQMQIDISLQLMLGRKHYASMIRLEQSSKEFQREAKRALKKVA